MNGRNASFLVEEQISRITQIELIEYARTWLIIPRCENRPWDYGDPGQMFPSNRPHNAPRQGQLCQKAQTRFRADCLLLSPHTKPIL